MKSGLWSIECQEGKLRVAHKYTATCDCGRKETINGHTFKQGHGCAHCRKKKATHWRSGVPLKQPPINKVSDYADGRASRSVAWSSGPGAEMEEASKIIQRELGS